MLSILHDFRFALRAFRKSPAFSIVAVLSLALDIGANTAILTLIDQLILSRLPVQDPDQLALACDRGVVWRNGLHGGATVARDRHPDGFGGAWKQRGRTGAARG